MAQYEWKNGKYVETTANQGLSYNADTGSYNTDGWSPEQWRQFGSSGGTVEGNKLMLDGNQIDAPKIEPVGMWGKDGFGMNQGTMQGLGQLGSLAQGLGSLYLGNKQLGLAEDTFAYNKEMKNKEYAMAKDSYDKSVARAADIGAQMNQGKVG